MNADLGPVARRRLRFLQDRLCGLIAATERDDDTVAVRADLLKQMLAAANELAAPAERAPQGVPPHYAGDGRITASDALRSMTSTREAGEYAAMTLWWWGCAFKYLWRWPSKGRSEDLRKAVDCIERLMGEEGWR